MKRRRTTISMDKGLLEVLAKETGARNKSEAIRMAAVEEIKRRQRESLLKLAGRLDFDMEAEAIRHGDSRLG